MKPGLRSALLSVGAVLFFCTPAPGENRTGAQSSVPAENERLWIAPFINKTRLEDLEGWPRDSLERSILRRHVDGIGKKLLSEFRRCEKYGLYKMVDDSSSATMRLLVTLDGYTRTKDTLTVPVLLHVASRSNPRVYDFIFYPCAGGVTDKNGSSPFHYAGDLVAELCSSFPYREIVYHFCSPVK